MYCSAITTRLFVGMLTPAIRATWKSLLVTQEKRERRPGPSNRPVRPSRPFAEAPRYRDRCGSVNAGARKYERKWAGARPLASPAFVSPYAPTLPWGGVRKRRKRPLRQFWSPRQARGTALAGAPRGP